MSNKDTALAPTIDSIMDSLGGYTGSDAPRANSYAPMIKILSDIGKQGKFFVDGEDLSGKDLGKMYIATSQLLDRTDLNEKITGVMIKEAFGTELVDANGQRVFQMSGRMSADKNEEYHDRYNRWPETFYQILLKFPTPITLSNGNEAKAVLIKVRGDSKKKYTEQVKKQQEALFTASAYLKGYFKHYSEVPTAFWKLTIGTESIERDIEKKDENGKVVSRLHVKYYAHNFSVELLPPEEMKAYVSDMLEARDIDIINFGMQGKKPTAPALPTSEEEPVAVQGEPIDLEELDKAITAQNGEKVDVKTTPKTDETTSDDDLPF